MKFYPQNSLVLACFICSILFFTSCSKDSDLLLDTVLVDQEIESIDNPGSDGSDGTDGSTGQNGSDPANPTSRGDGVNLLPNGTFNDAEGWNLLNGSNATGGVLTVIANGSVTSSDENWSAVYTDVYPDRVYESRRYRLTFEARQIVGNGELQIGQRYNEIATPTIASTWTQYSFEWNGQVSGGGASGNDFNLGGREVGDTWEFRNMSLEDIGITTIDSEAGLPGATYLFTDFSSNTYSYEQWGPNGSAEPYRNQWEVDNGEPRTTDHPDSPLRAGRNGGRAIWLGSYNGNSSRNEFGKDGALSYGEWWLAFSIYIADPMEDDRIYFQARNLAPGGSSTVNPLSLRQGSTDTQLYWSICDDVTRVDQTSATLGGWNGAGTGTSKVFFDYNPGEWIDIVVHYKGGFGANYAGPDCTSLSRAHAGHDLRSDGFVEIWANGTKIVDHVGTTLYRYEKNGGEIRGITPKIGPYWSNSSGLGNGTDIYYDNIIMWNGPDGTYQDVDPSR
ncbi:heparin lyase I family protein [Muriicola sp. E247]|uniref:heparin lyase I family protein n=1 Tax=Muriicola sp. E247 TaxID=3242730 RepID=UPI00352541A0